MTQSKGQNSYGHILKYTGVFGGVQGLSLLVSLVRNKFVAVLLGPEGMGIVGLYNASIKMLTDATGLGISTSAVRNISIAQETGSLCRLRHGVAVVRTWSVMAAVMGVVLCLALSGCLSRCAFSSSEYTVDFMLLAPVVGLATLVSRELAVLKGMHRLGALAYITLLNVLGALLSTVPIYWIWGIRGIVCALLAVAVLQTVFTFCFSVRACPWHFTCNLSTMRRFLGEGVPMVRLGVAFVLAALCGSGADYLIRIFLNMQGSTTDVGLFNAGYLMTMTYGGMVFSAMETDYYPRLSGCCADEDRMNETMNRQMEVSLLLLSPMLVCFSVLLPVLLPLLFSDKFTPILGMVQLVVVALYFRAVKLPISYLALAKGDSRSFLLLEGIYAVVFVALVTGGYRLWGLNGTGGAILVVAILDFLMLTFYTRWRYHFHIDFNVMRYLCAELAIAIFTYGAAWLSGWTHWLAGTILFLVSAFVTLRALRNKTNLSASLRKKFRRK